MGWGDTATIVLATVLAFASGFALTAYPLVRRGYSVKAAGRIALAADVASITIMELVDNAFMMLIRGAMSAPIDSLHFWSSMLVALAAGGLAAFPVNRWLISQGKGHAMTHRHH